MLVEYFDICIRRFIYHTDDYIFILSYLSFVNFNENCFHKRIHIAQICSHRILARVLHKYRHSSARANPWECSNQDSDIPMTVKLWSKLVVYCSKDVDLSEHCVYWRVIWRNSNRGWPGSQIEPSDGDIWTDAWVCLHYWVDIWVAG